MEILKTPWKDNLMELVSQSKKSIKITSPFVKENVCNELLSFKNNNTSLELITSFKLMNIHAGSLDLSGLENVIKNKGVVKNFPKLHSKIYLFDDKKVIITSGNLTNGGLLNNYEYGIYTDNAAIVSKVVADFSSISSNENIGKVKLTDIDFVRKLLAKIPLSESIKLPKFELESPEEKFDVIEIHNDIISSSLKGWKLEVFRCAQSIPNQIFSLKDINKFEPQLKKIYPSNHTITDKIRQQLQNLRDLGLLEFLGNGRYKKLWK
ncbi:MAG: phospholipase D-like domain-containing protein [Bacteroidota bacterium]|nr:phospholipase D-like domain-containing protein [Bacteroidota bacterium]